MTEVSHDSSDAARTRSKWASIMAWAATLAVPLLYAPWIVEPHLRYDDFDFLTRSRTWADTWANVYQPMNEHVIPLARLDAGIVMQLVQAQSALPRAAEIHGVAAVIAGMWLLNLFIRRELRHPFYGVVAMTLWGVTSTYYECVTWYSASFFTLALDGFLLGLLAAQSYARTHHVSALVLCALCCALAPAFHSTALLGGA